MWCVSGKAGNAQTVERVVPSSFVPQGVLRGLQLLGVLADVAEVADSLV